jgi:hypothetical protein
MFVGDKFRKKLIRIKERVKEFSKNTNKIGTKSP